MTTMHAEVESRFRRLDEPFESFDSAQLGSEYDAELEVVRNIWLECGYRPGVSAYLNFFLLGEFIELHDRAMEPRFRTFRSMGNSFYQTDLFIREVTDSGRERSGGIASESVRKTLASIMRRHQAVSIPPWMMSYFGYSLFENVEQQMPRLTEEERRLHLQYMSRTYRIMGVHFCNRRDDLEDFARCVESVCAAPSPNLERHARNILLLGEMIGVRSSWQHISSFLPEPTRSVLEPLHADLRPSLPRRVGARILGRLTMKKAVGSRS